MIRIGVIGVGQISQWHIKSYLKCKDVQLVAICDLNEELLRDVAQTYNIPKSYRDYRELLRDSDIDAVSICTSNHMHAPMAIAALEAKKHVLCEKPMAHNLQEAIAMEKASRIHNRLLMIGFVRRFGKDVDYATKQINNLGEIYYGKASYLRRQGSPGSWFIDPKQSGGGAMIDIGIHMLDMMCYLCDDYEVSSVLASTAYKKCQDAFEVEELTTATISFRDGKRLYLDTSYCLHGEDINKLELFGTEGGMKIDSRVTEYSSDGERDIVHHYAFNEEEAFEGEIKHFVEAVQGRIQCKCTAKQGVAIMEIINSIYESARTGELVMMREENYDTE